MNFYKRWIGDIQRDTGHLSCAEMGVYDRLLDHYYATESALPNDIDACCRIARAMTKDERKAVASVLSQYFTLTNDGYEQGRAEKEIAEAQPAMVSARLNGAKGGRPKKAENITQEKPNGFSNNNPSETQVETSPEPEPNTINLCKSVEDSNLVEPYEFNPTPSGIICKALTEIRLPPFNASNPKFLALVEAGATKEEFINTAQEIKSKDPSKFNFDYLLGTMTNRRKDAKNLDLKKGAMQIQSSREAGRHTAAKSIFTSANTQHLMASKEIEVQDATAITN